MYSPICTNFPLSCSQQRVTEARRSYKPWVEGGKGERVSVRHGSGRGMRSGSEAHSHQAGAELWSKIGKLTQEAIVESLKFPELSGSKGVRVKRQDQTSLSAPGFLADRKARESTRLQRLLKTTAPSAEMSSVNVRRCSIQRNCLIEAG